MKKHKTRSKFKYDVGETIVDENKNITIINRRKVKDKNGYFKKMYQYQCNICGWDNGWRTEHYLEKCKFCACCHGNVVVEGINDIPTTAPWMIDYFQGGFYEAKLYTKTSGKTIIPVCPYCNKVHNKNVRIITLFKNHGFGCECSSDKISYPEKFIIHFLKSNNINFIYQLSKANIEWACKYKYDFYLQNYNTIIKVNGGQHYKESIGFLTSLETQKKIDDIKKQIALNNGIQHYIKLDCSKSNVEYISNSIIKSNLFDILKLNKDINWNECDYFAQSNLLKEVCNYYMSTEKNTSKIANYFNLDVSTICRYLRKGKQFNWCDYNSGRKKIEMFSGEGVSLGVYDSAKDIVEKTNLGFSTVSIRNACIGKYKNHVHKGFIFKYV